MYSYTGICTSIKHYGLIHQDFESLIYITTSSKTNFPASFYGGSFISLPLQEAKSSTDIQFKFKTRLPNALLLLVAGKTDYCIVRLYYGQIKININLGAGESEILATHSPNLTDFQWHQVHITRKEANFTVFIDNVPTIK